MTTHSLDQLLNELVRAAARRYATAPIDITIDCEALPIPMPPKQLQAILLPLLERSLRAMPGGGELVITAVSMPQALEIEIADSAAEEHAAKHPVANPASHNNLQRADHIAQLFGAHITRQKCPEGGMAATLVVPRVSARMAA